MHKVNLEMLFDGAGKVTITACTTLTSHGLLVNMLDPDSYVHADHTTALRSVHTLVTNMMKIVEAELEGGNED